MEIVSGKRGESLFYAAAGFAENLCERNLRTHDQRLFAGLDLQHMALRGEYSNEWLADIKQVGGVLGLMSPGDITTFTAHVAIEMMERAPRGD